MVFREGFTYNNFRYGLKNKVLYRLPITKDNRSYPMKIVPVIKLSETSEGYRIARDKKSLLQVRSMVEKVNWKYNNIDCRECK